MRKMKSNIEVMSQEEVLLIHNTVVKILSNIGMNVPNKEVLQICADHGAVIDLEKEVMKIPPQVMEDFVEIIRTKAEYKPTNEPCKLGAYISTQVTIVDYTTKQRRYGMRDDNLKGFALCEHLQNLPCASNVVVPHDVPYEISDVICYADAYKYSTKPGGTYILTPLGAKYITEINRLFGNPNYYLFESISPLSFKKDTVDMALEFAKNGDYLSIAPMAMSAATAPVTVAGTLALECAEVLGSSFIVYALTGRLPGFSASCHSVDPKTMLCSFGSPNQGLFAVAVSQMAKFYGIQGGSNTGLTDALMPDFQSGFEKGVTAALNSLSGMCSIGCQGIAGADQGVSLEQLVIDNEWIGYYNYILDGFDVTEEAIGYDVIEEVGIKGNFLAEEHTVEYMKDSYWMSNIFNRDDWMNWVQNGSKDILDRAHEFVEKVTAGYQNRAPVIDAAKCDELDRIVRAAHEELNLKA